MQTTEQYKDALMSESIVMYQVNFSKDTIENGIYQRKNNKMYSALDTVGISTSSSYDEYCRRWQKRVSKDTIEDYLKLATSKKIIELFNNGLYLLITGQWIHRIRRCGLISLYICQRTSLQMIF